MIEGVWIHDLWLQVEVKVVVGDSRQESFRRMRNWYQHMIYIRHSSYYHDVRYRGKGCLKELRC